MFAQKIRVYRAGVYIRIAFSRKPEESMLNRLRQLGKWLWASHVWTIVRTAAHHNQLFDALANYLDLRAAQFPDNTIALQGSCGGVARWRI